ncbi:MAG: T9SS type A sorting domain-containing protein [Lewinellaceae bacterium]|nr:T9SS type A sorting domain-containing protein [Lewinellaceae bacterium]
MQNASITNSEVDLYSVVLHEALHLLGYASRIGLNGGSLGGGSVYSDWDKYLYSELVQDYLIVPDPNGECCDAHRFNSEDFPNMPQDLSGGCNMQISFFGNGSAIAPVNNVNLNPSSDNDMANKLSHLDQSCGSENYVMHPSVDPGEIRRDITGPEVQILCFLGYSAAGDCGVDCTVITQDDLFGTPLVLNGQNSALIPLNFVLANDVFSGTPAIALVPNCGNSAGISVSLGANGFTVTGITAGIWSFCYSVSTCPGSCDQAEVTVIVLSTPIGDDCGPQSCDLICYGDFEGFVPGGGTFNAQMGLPNFHINGSANGDNSVDLFTDGSTGSTIVRWVNFQSGSWEIVGLPLDRPIPPGCRVDVSFQASASAYNAQGGAPTLGIYGATDAPCNTINEPNCAGTASFDLCNNTVDAFCMQSYTIPLDAGVVNDPPGSVFVQGLDLQPYSFSWTNPGPDDVTNLLIYGTDGAQDFHQFFLDNIRVVLYCGNTITITPKVIQQCIDGQAIIEYEVCIEDPQGGAVPILLDANIPVIPGLSIAPGGGFDANGIAHVLLPDNDGDPNCTVVTLTLNAGANITPGTTINVALSASSSAQDICFDLNGDTDTNVPLTFENCDWCNNLKDISVVGECRGDQVILTVLDRNGDPFDPTQYLINWTTNGTNTTGVNPITVNASTVDYIVEVLYIDGDVAFCVNSDTGRIVCDTIPSGCGITVTESCDSCGNVVITAVFEGTNIPVPPTNYLHEFYWWVYGGPGDDDGVLYQDVNSITIHADACYSLMYHHYVYPPGVPQVPGYHTSICKFQISKRCVTVECPGSECENFPTFFIAGCGDDLDQSLNLTFPGNCQSACGPYIGSSVTLGVFYTSNNQPVDPGLYNITWENGTTGTYAYGNLLYIDKIRITGKGKEACCVWEDKYTPDCMCNGEPGYVHCEIPVIKYCASDGSVTYTYQPPQIVWYGVPGATSYQLEVTFDNMEEGCCRYPPPAGTLYYTVTGTSWVFPANWTCFTIRVKAINPEGICTETEWSYPYTYCQETNSCFPVITTCGCCHERAENTFGLSTVVIEEEELLARLQAYPGKGYSTLSEALRAMGYTTATEPGITVYPNPARHEIVVEFVNHLSETDSYTFGMYDVYGREVLRRTLDGSAQSHTIRISTLAPGAYTWRVTGVVNDKVSQTGKLIIVP